MNLSDLPNNPFFIKFIEKTAHMLGEWYQQKAPSMTNDELYVDSEFFPIYNPDRDYSMKPDGYVCKSEDGIMMRLVRPASVGIMRIGASGEAALVNWKSCWSTDPILAHNFVSSEISPYNVDEVCLFNGYAYKSLVDNNTKSPFDAPDDWQKV